MGFWGLELVLRGVCCGSLGFVLDCWPIYGWMGIDACCLLCVVWMKDCFVCCLGGCCTWLLWFGFLDSLLMGLWDRLFVTGYLCVGFSFIL